MGACSSSPAASDTLLAANTNSSPVHAAVTQVKEKRPESAEAGNTALLDAPQAADSDTSNQTADAATDSQSAAADTAVVPAAKPAADESKAEVKADGGVSSRKEKEETKEQTVEIRPVSASQKLSARSVAPLPTITATAIVTPVTPTAAATAPADNTASAAPTTVATVTDASAVPTTAAPVTEVAVEDFPTTLPSTTASQFSASDLKFKSTVLDVLVLLLDRFTRTMEYEKAAFQELAVGVGYTNYMQLFDYAAFESFLRLHYIIPPSPTPQQQDNDLRYISQYFTLFLTLAQSGESTTANRTMPNRVQFTSELQSLCASTAEQLRKWCVNQHATAEVKEHLLFFATALKFAEGDLINQPDILYKNIDDICD